MAVCFLKAQCCQWGSKNHIVLLIVVCVLGTSGWSWNKKVLLSLLGHCYQKGQLKPGSARKTAAHTLQPSFLSYDMKTLVPCLPVEWLSLLGTWNERPCHYCGTRNTSKQDASWEGLPVCLTPPLNAQRRLVKSLVTQIRKARTSLFD